MKVTTGDPPPLPKTMPHPGQVNPHPGQVNPHPGQVNPHPGQMNPHSGLVNAHHGQVNLTQSDHDMIKSFLSSSTLVFPLSPGTALGELVSFAPPSPTMAHMSSLAFSHAPPSPSIPHSHLASLSHAPPSPSLSHLASLTHTPASPHLPNLSLSHDHHITPDIRLEPLGQTQNTVPVSVMDLSHNVFGKSIPDQLFISNIPQDQHWPETLSNKKTNIKSNNKIRVEKQTNHFDKEDHSVVPHHTQVIQQPTVIKATDQFKNTDLVKRKIPDDSQESPTLEKTKPAKKKKRRRKMKKLLSELKAEGFEKATELEDCSEQVQKRLQSGCECDQKCFSSLKTELVYRHRCNIAELSKGEHDMYLMGVVLTSLADPSSTTKHKERQRHRNKYVFRGKEVCQDAFLYLENITLYQLKSIRKHVTNHGVVPRIHKNKGKKPHNVFQLDHYQLAHRFVEDLLQEEVLGKKKTLPKDLTCTKLHENYKEYFEKMDLNCEQRTKIMAYSTFRNFVHERFPQVKFSGRDSEAGGNHVKMAVDSVRKDFAWRPEGCIDLPVVETSICRNNSTLKLDMTNFKT